MGLFDSKTEAPTPKRREDARKKGQIPRSREVVAVAVLVAGFWALRKSGPSIWNAWRQDCLFYLDAAMGPDRAAALASVPHRVIATLGISLVPVLLALTLASLVANVAQSGLPSKAQLKWDASKLNPGQGLKRLFSAGSLVELAKSVAKVGLCGWVLYRWLGASYPAILTMSAMDMHHAGLFACGLVVAMFWKAILVLGLIAAADYGWQRYSLESQLRMTQQEVRDEIRQQEGSPEIKGAIRRRQREMARRRMMADVPTATVVVTNPTHYAVALRYEPGETDAPQVVALGQRLVAQRIKELAREHGVPTVENPPLARALFAACDVGDLVPAELYAAVAEVLAYVYRLTGKRLPGR